MYVWCEKNVCVKLSHRAQSVSKTFYRRLVWRELAYWQLHHWPLMAKEPIRQLYRQELKYSNFSDYDKQIMHFCMYEVAKISFPFPIIDKYSCLELKQHRCELECDLEYIMYLTAAESNSLSPAIWNAWRCPPLTLIIITTCWFAIASSGCLSTAPCSGVVGLKQQHSCKRGKGAKRASLWLMQVTLRHTICDEIMNKNRIKTLIRYIKKYKITCSCSSMMVMQLLH